MVVDEPPYSNLVDRIRARRLGYDQEQLPLPSSSVEQLPALTQNLTAAILSSSTQRLPLLPTTRTWRTAVRWLGGGNAKKDWFRQLYKYSTGNLEEAFLLWKEGIESIDDNKGRMHLGIIGHRRSPIEDLDDSDLILMRQILRHGWISTELAEEWFLSPAARMKVKLTSMKSMGLLDEHLNHWTLSVGVRRPLRERLNQKGWL